ncbi:hypothetical protein PI125_g26687 [Phytophthora idaei]|nr:hypothetical protein PI125_g26687 [Phytophthora idaei]
MLRADATATKLHPEPLAGGGDALNRENSPHRNCSRHHIYFPISSAEIP